MKLLIIEDEVSMQNSISAYFTKSGYICEIATQSDAEEKVRLYHYDCVILDITLPDKNGLRILEQIRKGKGKTGVIILSVENSIDDKVEALNLGADDYLTKPFHFAELNARVSAIIRRLSFEGNHQIEIGNLLFQLEAQKVFVDGKELILKKKEYELLLFFVSNMERVISKVSLAEHIWSENIDRSASFAFLYSQIKNLRKCLREYQCEYNIQAVYGLGYKFIQG